VHCTVYTEQYYSKQSLQIFRAVSHVQLPALLSLLPIGWWVRYYVVRRLMYGIALSLTRKWNHGSGVRIWASVLVEQCNLQHRHLHLVFCPSTFCLPFSLSLCSFALSAVLVEQVQSSISPHFLSLYLLLAFQSITLYICPVSSSSWAMKSSTSPHFFVPLPVACLSVYHSVHLPCQQF
jgi:hypothetical protein